MERTGPFTEEDWKYLRSIHDELLHALCDRINSGAVAVASGHAGNPHERYIDLYRFVKDSDKIIAQCFNGWRRSQMEFMVISLRQHGLLKDTHVRKFSPSAQEWLARIEQDFA